MHKRYVESARVGDGGRKGETDVEKKEKETKKKKKNAVGGKGRKTRFVCLFFPE